MHYPSLLSALLALTTAVAASEFATVAVAADLDANTALACKRRDWQGGGCENKWGGDCIQRCRAQAGSHGCGSGCTVRSWEDGSGCVWGWETCECYCN